MWGSPLKSTRLPSQVAAASRYLSAARQRRVIARRLQLIAKVEAKLLALETRGRRGDLVAATDIAAAAATIVGRPPVKVLFAISDVAEGRFVYDYNHDALDYGACLVRC